MHDSIQADYVVVTSDGDDIVGTVRAIRKDARELVLYIENGGEFTVPFTAVQDVHSGKVVLAHEHLPADLREAIRHARDAEYPHGSVAGLPGE
jgi:hypothetical protein